jgi:hypothetical protein
MSAPHPGKSSYLDLQNRERIRRPSIHPYRTAGHCFFSGIQVFCSPQMDQLSLQQQYDETMYLVRAEHVANLQ